MGGIARGARILLGRLGSRLRGRVEEAGGSSEGAIGSVKPENIVWIFGAGRTGSTWLSRMMGEAEGHTVWNEPLVGALFGHLYYVRAPHRRGRNFVLGGKRETWLPAVRTFVLQVTHLKYPDVEEDGYLVIKEPGGSIGAPLLMEALPESRMVLLIRDPRDVVASRLDASREGSYRNENLAKKLGKTPPSLPPDIAVEGTSQNLLQQMGNAKQAYEAHEGRKVLVKYEELRADPLGTMKRIYSALEIPADEGELERAVMKHSWENVPEELKGEGKIFRKATPGGWREDLTPRQVEIVERITAPILEDFYSETTRS